MIYETPICRPLGDCYLAIEFGDEANLDLSFRALKLAQFLEEEGLDGVVEICPTGRTLALIYDRTLTDYGRLEATVRDSFDAAGERDELQSRRITIPVWYDDPWSAEVAERFEVPNNLELVAGENGVSTEEFIAKHTGTDFWVAMVGFTPGCNLHYPMEPGLAMRASKYRTPRTFTPDRVIGMAGIGTCLYPVASPGGYQMVGRAAVGIYDPTGRHRDFPDDGVLIRTGDRIRYRSVAPLEYDELYASYLEGGLPAEIEDETFSISKYTASVEATQSETAEAGA